MNGIGAESGVNAGAIVFWTILRLFHIRGKICGKAVLPAWRSSAVIPPGGVRGSKIRRRHGAVLHQGTELSRQPRKVELSTRTVTWPRPPSRGLLYIFAGAGTLRKNASSN